MSSHGEPTPQHDHPQIVATISTAAGKQVRTIQVVRPEPSDTSFLAASAKGFAVTVKHFARNVFLPGKNAAARSKAGAPDDAPWRNEIETVQYPEEKVTYPERFRGLHRLTLRDDGAVRCV